MIGPWHRRYYRGARLGVPPHITLHYPFVPVERLERDDAILDGLRALCAAHAPFDFALTGLAQFPGVLYATPEPAAPFYTLTAALSARYPEAPLYGDRYQTLIPHLSVAHGENQGVFDQIAATLTPAFPIPIHTSELWLMAEQSNGLWYTPYRFPLCSRMP